MLRQFEKDVLDRINRLENPLGWKPHGRDDDGNARLKAEWKIAGGTRVAVMTIAPKGLSYTEMLVVD